MVSATHQSKGKAKQVLLIIDVVCPEVCSLLQRVDSPHWQGGMLCPLLSWRRSDNVHGVDKPGPKLFAW
jgi:hypothetical protein